MKKMIKGLVICSALLGMLVLTSNNVNANTKNIYIVNETNTNTNTNTTNSTANQYVSNKEITVYKMNNNNPDYNQPVQLPTNSTFTLSNYFNNGNILNPKETNDFYYLPQSNISSYTYNPNSVDLSKAQFKKLTKNADQWKKGLSKTQIKAIGNYSESGYGNINTYLRNPHAKMQDANKSDVIKDINNIKTSIGRFNLTNPMSVYRGTSLDSVSKSLGNKPLELGSIYNDAAFSSTSVDKSGTDSFNQNVILKINLPTGYHGAYIAPVASIKSEKEYLLDPGTKMIVSNIQDVNGHTSNKSITYKSGKKSPKNNLNKSESKNYKLVTLNLVNE